MDASRKRLTLLACILGSAVVTLDATVVTVGLPAIREELGGGLAGQQWTANAYLVTLASLLLVGGALSDAFGVRRAFVAGAAGFGLTSLACALAPTIEALVVARALQGVSGALLTPAALAAIVAAFPREERSRAIGAWTAWSGIGAVAGPLVGGQLVDAASWRWIFALNVPLIAATILLAARALPGSADPGRRRLDLPGAVLCTAGLTGLSFGLIQQPLSGWGDPLVAGSLAGGAALLAAFLGYERRAAEPMLPLELFARRNFAVGNLETLAFYAGFSIVFFYLVIFLQQVAAYSALEAGLVTIPVAAVVLLIASRLGALADRLGPRLFMGAGPLVSAAGIALLAFVDEGATFARDLLPGLTVFSLGLAMTVAPLTATVLADADEHNAGVASGVNNAIARVAGLVGVAAIGVLVAARFGAALDGAVDPSALSEAARAALEDARADPLALPDLGAVPAAERDTVAAAVEGASVDAFRFGMAAAAVLVAAGGLLGLLGIRNPRRHVPCRGCEGGQLVGQPLEAALHES